VSAPELSVVLPAYEEASNLAWLLPRIHAALDAAGVTHEVVVVDTESPQDDTAGVCARNDARCHPREGGDRYGDAVRTGLTAARGSWIAFMDADGSHAAESLVDLWHARHTADLVIGSRYVTGGRSENPLGAVLLSRALNVVFRVTFGLRCADVSNSLRLYRAEDLRRIHLHARDFDVVEEALVQLLATRPGYRVREIPATFERRREGRTKRELGSFALGYLGTIRRLHRFRRNAGAAP
jgi:dolichol-phosphate mannosyltransferase